MLKLKSIFNLDNFVNMAFILIYIAFIGAIAGVIVGLPYVLCWLIDVITFYFFQWHYPFNFFTWLLSFSLLIYLRIGLLKKKPDDALTLMEFLNTKFKK